MVLQPTDSFQEALAAARRELARAVQDKRHPMRFFALASAGPEGPVVRTVVLRGMPVPFCCRVYTDARSRKVAAFREGSLASLLFYHPGKKFQLTIQARPVLHHGDAIARDCWARIPDFARADYTTVQAPGTSVEEYAIAHRWASSEEDAHFCVLDFEPLSLELLQLRREGNIRLGFMPGGGEGGGVKAHGDSGLGTEGGGIVGAGDGSYVGVGTGAGARAGAGSYVGAGTEDERNSGAGSSVGVGTEDERNSDAGSGGDGHGVGEARASGSSDGGFVPSGKRKAEAPGLEESRIKGGWIGKVLVP